jgi:hypothetical protein
MHRNRALLAVMLPLLSCCAGNMKHMTTYQGAADSFAKDACGQFCWSQEKSKSGREFCSNSQASAPLQECVAQLRAAGPLLVDKQLAQTQLQTCMQEKQWWRITAFIIICD